VSKIKRYDIDCKAAKMCAFEDGGYVKFSDYVAALQRLRKECAEKAKKKLHAMVKPQPMCRDCADENGTCPTTGFPCDRMDWPEFIAAEIRKE